MRETLKNWKTEWIETNGKTDGIEVLISYNSSDEYIYEGSFSNIPEELEAKKSSNTARFLTQPFLPELEHIH